MGKYLMPVNGENVFGGVAYKHTSLLAFFHTAVNSSTQDHHTDIALIAGVATVILFLV